MGEEVEGLVRRLRDFAAEDELILLAPWPAIKAFVTEAADTLERVERERDEARDSEEDYRVSYLDRHERATQAEQALETAEAQVEAMRKARDEAVQIGKDLRLVLRLAALKFDFSLEGSDTLDRADEFFAALASSTPERSLGSAVDESAARRPADVCDQPLRAALEEIRDGLVASREDISVDDWIEIANTALSAPARAAALSDLAAQDAELIWPTVKAEESSEQAEPVAFVHSIDALRAGKDQVAYPKPLGTYRQPLYAVPPASAAHPEWQPVETMPNDRRVLVDFKAAGPIVAYRNPKWPDELVRYLGYGKSTSWPAVHVDFALGWMDLPAPAEARTGQPVGEQ